MAPKAELVRFALAGAAAPGRSAVLDRDGKMPGRGAYLCRERQSGGPAAACLARAQRNGGVARTLRAAVTIDNELIESVSR